ncbi:MAG: HD domain-containing protein [Methanosarcinaceae archaeon]|nr:HD domain-containing protein [Methanosarcinaceae archaeon]
MKASSFNKRKIFNDPVYGFISIPDELLFDIIEHPYFQRLRRIKQLGLTHLVYPGALHTRFHHSLGAMHLMRQAIDTIRFKGTPITKTEEMAVMEAILLHDIGHSPYSHTLEKKIVPDLSHEDLSLLFMQALNLLFDKKLETAIGIFTNTYPKHFLHQLVSSQLDMDRLDFLKRDSFYTGVSEGVINTDRIIEMLDVAQDELVVEAKGIYSIEKFIVARRLMYWQVYLHKTVLAAEKMLIKLLDRARELLQQGDDLFMTPPLSFFLKNTISRKDFLRTPDLLDLFSTLDDFDVYTSIKVWISHPDKILSMLSKGLLMRHLFRIEMQHTPYDTSTVDNLKERVSHTYKIPPELCDYLVCTDLVANKAYDPYSDHIKIIYKNGEVVDIEKASEQFNVALLSQKVTKYYLWFPKYLISEGTKT